MNSSSNLISIAQLAQQSAAALAGTHQNTRSAIIRKIAEAVRSKQDDILEANTLDLEVSREMAIPDLLVDWLKLTPERLQTTSQVLQHLSETPDPLYSTDRTDGGDGDCDVYGIRTPLGTVAFVYEAFPELAAIAAGFCIRTGNVLILRGGAEAASSNQIIADVIQEILQDAGLPQGCVQLLPSDQGDMLRECVTLDGYIDLVIPYGRASLMQKVLKQASIPVLKTAISNCYLFWSLTGDVEQVRHIIVDSYRSVPDMVNAIDHVLIHRGCNSGVLASLFGDLKTMGFKLKGEPDLCAKFPGLDPVKDAEWHQAYLDRAIAFKLVDGLDDAIQWMNRYSSGHANTIVTESYGESRQFATQLKSAEVYINTSPRFYRHHPGSGKVALGMSTQSTHRQGVIDLNALTTVKRIIQGNLTDSV